MGLSFHYNGRISKAELLPELIDEIQDIAKAYNWKYFVFDRQFLTTHLKKKNTTRTFTELISLPLIAKQFQYVFSQMVV